MARYWTNDAGYSLSLQVRTGFSARVVLADADDRPVFTKSYDCWNTRLAESEAEALATVAGLSEDTGEPAVRLLEAA